MKTIHKIIKYLFCINFIFLIHLGYGQKIVSNKIPVSLNTKTKNNIHELSYQFPFMFGYSYYHNFNNKIVPGLGLKLGYGYLVNGYYGSGWSEFLSAEIKFKNLFSREKLGHLVDYDVGIAYSWMPMQAAHFYGIAFSPTIKIVKIMKLGVNMKVGNIKESDDDPFVWLIWNPYLLFTF